MEPIIEPHLESPKRTKFSFPFFRRNRDKQLSPQNAEVAERKIIVEEGHRYLAEATDLIHQNREHLHRKDPGLQQMLGDRWAELYGSAPSGKKLTKGRLTPEDFRDKSRSLLADVQEQFEFLKIDEESAGSSTQHHEQPREQPPSLKRGQSVRREPSHRQKTELRDEGPARTRDVQFDASPQRSPREAPDPSYSSRKGLSRHNRDDRDDRRARQLEGRQTDSGPRLDDRRPSEQSKHSTSERPKNGEERDTKPRRRDDREDRHRDDRDDRRRDIRDDRRRDDRDDRYRDDRDDRYRDRYRDNRREDRDRRRDRDDRYDYDDRYYRGDRYRDDRYRSDRYRDDRRRDDRYYDDRRSYDRRRDERRYYDRSYDDSRGDGRRYSEDKYRDGRRGEERRRDDHRRKEGRREGDDSQRDRRHDREDHEMERQSSRHHEDHEMERQSSSRHHEDHEIERQSSSRHHEDEAAPEAPIPVPMSPTYIPYPGEDEKPRRRSTHRHREGDHSSENHPQTPARSRNHSPSPKAEFVTDPALLSPDHDSRRNSHQSREELPQ